MKKLSILFGLIAATLIVWSSISAETPQGVATVTTANAQPYITYQGFLEKNGIPVTANDCTLYSTFYDQPTDGSQVGTATSNTVDISDGLFSANIRTVNQTGMIIGNPPSLFDGRDTWLDLQIQCSGDASPITLTPRTKMAAAPAAHTLLAGALIRNVQTVTTPASQTALLIESDTDGMSIDAAGGALIVTSEDDGIIIDHAGDVGIEVQSSANDAIYVNSTDGIGLHVANAQSSGVVASTSSADHYGGYFRNRGGTAQAGVGLYARGNQDVAPDIVLGGGTPGIDDDGVIVSDPDLPNSQFVIKSNHDIYLDLDNNMDSSNSKLRLRNGQNAEILTVSESGNMVTGQIEATSATNETPDLVLGGNSAGDSLGLITTDPAYADATLALQSNAGVTLQLDEDDNSGTVEFTVLSGNDTTLLTVSEDRNVTQPLPGSGLVKAAVNVTCGNSGSAITNAFNGVTSDAITINNGTSAGRCSIQFPFPITGRFWQVSAHDTGANSAEIRYAQCSLLTGFENTLTCFRWNAFDNGINGELMILLY